MSRHPFPRKLLYLQNPNLMIFPLDGGVWFSYFYFVFWCFLCFNDEDGCLEKGWRELMIWKKVKATGQTSARVPGWLSNDGGSPIECWVASLSNFSWNCLLKRATAAIQWWWVANWVLGGFSIEFQLELLAQKGNSGYPVCFLMMLMPSFCEMTQMISDRNQKYLVALDQQTMTQILK